MSENFILKNPTTGLPVGTAAVFLTLGSALVALYRGDGPKTTASGLPIDFRWHCLGCGDGETYGNERKIQRDKANNHAAQCRSIPWHQGDPS